jgi:DNA recombination protein RmuC
MPEMVTVVGIAAFLLGLLVGLVVWYRSTRSARSELERLNIDLTRLETEKQADAEKLRWSETAESQLKNTFTALAHEALKANAETLTSQAKQDLGNLVKPLSDNVTNLEKNVREMEQKREGAYQGIKEQLRTLGETHARLQRTTYSLTEALKSPTVRGRWGELQLRRVVEMAGMQNHVTFEEQQVAGSGRPDMIIHLPNAGVLPIDSKVPMDSYMAAMEEKDPDRRKELVGAHARALRERVRELAQKQYWEQFERSPDFVVMFVPNEGCLGAAYEVDPEILDFAINKHVLPCAPVNLVALLRAVAYGWQQQQVAENANRIAEEGRDLYTRFQTWIAHFKRLGASIDSSVEFYNKAIGSLNHRLMPSARRFQELGIADSEISPPPEIDGRTAESALAPAAADETDADWSSRDGEHSAPDEK